MPYIVTGFVEVLLVPGEDDCVWCAALDLSAFVLAGCPVSHELFGLSKSPDESACFAARGIPADASPAVRRTVAENALHVQQYGEGDVGHTYALWSELASELETDGLRALMLAAPVCEWPLVMQVVGLLELRYRADEIRFVVWGNW